MADESELTKEIFLEAVAKPTPAERDAYVAAACGGDQERTARVQTLLRAHDQVNSALDRPAAEQFGLTTERPEPGQVVGGSAAAALGGDHPAARGRLGHYRILEHVGQGAFATVFKALDEKLQRIVAVKVLAPALAASGSACQRFLREARAAAAVRNEHIIAIYAVEEDPSPYLVMEFIDGPTVQQKLARTGPLAVKEILRIGYQVATGLAAAHRLGLIHRDIKPGNILLENGVERIKLCDFGLARAADDASLTQSGLIAGTPLYMSPEQAGGQHIDHRSDLFSLGSVLYALGTGHAPFRADCTLAVLRRIAEDAPRSMRDSNAEIPEWLEAVVTRLLAKDPAQRFASAQEVADVLAGYLTELQAHGPLPRHEPVAVPVKPPAPAGFRTSAPGSRRRRWAVGLGVVVVLAGVVLLRGYWSGAPAEPSPDAGPVRAAPVVNPANPLDRWSRQDLPPHLLALAGGGQPAQAPAELVGVVGTSRFPLSGDRLGGMSVAPGGELLAVPAGPQVFLFETRTGHLVRQFTAHERQLGQLDFSADGKQLLSVGDDNLARLWDLATGKLRQVFRGHTDMVTRAIFDPEGKTVFTTSIDGTVRLWEAATGQPLLQPLQHPHRVYCLAFSPKEPTTFVTGCHDRNLRVWDRTTGELKHTLSGHTNEINSVAFSPDGKYLVSGSQELRVWDAATFQELHTLPAESQWLGFGPGGRTVLAAKTPHGDEEAYVVTRWDVATGKPLPALTLKHRGGWGTFAISPDGKTLFAARQNPNPERHVRAYDTETGAERFPQSHGHSGQVWSVAFHRDASLLASGGDDHTVRLWNLAGQRDAEGQSPVDILPGHSQTVWCVRFSPDGKLLASSSLDRTILLWDVAQRQRIRTLQGHFGTFSRIAFAPDGRTIAGGQEDGTIKFWDVASGQETLPFAGHSAAVRCVAYSPDGKFLASAGVDRTVQVHAIPGGQLLQKFTLPSSVDHVAYAADGKHLVCTTDSNDSSTLNVWDTATWKHTCVPSHASLTSALALNPTGSLALTGGSDRMVRVWDLRKGATHIATFGPGPFGALPAELAFTADGRYWASANQNGTITILRTPELPE